MAREKDRGRQPTALETRQGRIIGFTTSLLVPGQIALEISSGRDFLCGYREPDAVITMARFRTLSARRNAVISAAQCRSARALLGWSVAKLASAASVSASAIDDFEAERRAPLPAVVGPIRRAFELIGVAFLPGKTSACARGRRWRSAATARAFTRDRPSEAAPPDRACHAVRD
jgi:transcriptional regulator with XRE-family HTH domain